ncbi:MAG: 3-hydroxyacyl-CoA dehydrogenase NAD-binding domain-containing protein [Alphaproteobacteria bacterium]|nr:3-hydroxyacyl-CoA dehydrogenase NAD-binding domain-containing protein [Alphaproteobacteria bacterium]
MSNDTQQPIRRVMVVGYGTMGRGIALSFARAGFETTVMSRDPSRHGALPHGMTAVADPPAEAPDLIIESVPEETPLKHALFAQLESCYGTGSGGPILGTNTSGLPIEEIAAPLSEGSRSRFMAIHYMQPADTLPMVECAMLEETLPEVAERAQAALERSGKQVIMLRRPVIGFLINRLQHAVLHEAYHLIEEGIVTVEDVDAFARTLFGPRMCITGLIEQKDLSGLSVHALAQQSIVPALHHSAEPNKMVQAMIAGGDIGAASGKGFYNWRERDATARAAEAKAQMGQLIDFLAALRKSDDGETATGAEG